MNKDIREKLIGSWVSDAMDNNGAEKIHLEFAEGGYLTYTIIGEHANQHIFLTFRIEDNLLITDQPSHPQEERTQFSLASDGKLVLIHGDQIFKYVRN